MDNEIQEIAKKICDRCETCPCKDCYWYKSDKDECGDITLTSKIAKILALGYAKTI